MSVDTTYHITSLWPEQAVGRKSKRVSRGHSTVEDRVHCVLDVTMAEDASLVHTGNPLQTSATFAQRLC